ncbi:glutamate receptor ionotropic, kainate 3-like isoform X2 [Stegodyphus dumicola]|uniref:glutamate receptor ionotropic, kainate 3-like isoform X2 n=1 Tax=Stegodyphus dumicola TaxID=202533 RepID=UPI0015AD7859|nr:glutamate receptor ionotropic, kainate 3-like isoform X2 [Stegodyphus dumicola]
MLNSNMKCAINFLVGCGLLAKGVAAVLGPQSELLGMHVQSVCDGLEVPFIDSRWDYRLRRENLAVNLYPHPNVLSSAFVRLIQIWGWTEFFLVYEEDEAIVRMKEFLIEGEKQEWKIKLYKFNHSSSFRDTFWKIKRSVKLQRKELNIHIVLDVSRENLYTAMKAAQQVGLMTEDQKYLITNLDLHTIDMEDFQHTKANITSLRLVQEETAEFQMVLEEVNYRLTQRRDEQPLKTLKTEAALLYDSVRLLSYALEQMNLAKNITSIPPIYCKSMNKGIDGTSLVNFMKSAKMSTSGLTGKIKFDAEGFRSEVSLDVMYVTADGLKKIGTVLPDNVVNITSPGSSEFQYMELEHSHFKVTTFLEAHLAIADLTITESRLEAVDFTLPFMQTGISILFKKPTQKVTSLFSFLSPFSGEVWLLVMAAYTFISLSYFLVGRLSPYEWSNPHPCRQTDLVEENVFSLLNSMWFAIGSLMQQGSDIAPTAMSTRAITSFWYFFCLIMISSYTANLAAFLTVEKLVSPIENVEDLANQEKIKYGCLANGSTSGFFKNSNMSTYKKMHKFMMKHASEVFVSDNTEGINKVKQGDYAYLMEATSIEYNTERECNLTQIGGLLDSKGYGIAVKKGDHKLRNWLTGGILRLQQEGQLHTLKERWWKQKKGGGSCSQTSKASGSVNELGLGNVGGVFVVMLLGICLSACAGVAEFFWFQRKLEKDPEMSMFKLLMREIKYAVTCGSSSKPAPKMKKQFKEGGEVSKGFPGYSSLE